MKLLEGLVQEVLASVLGNVLDLQKDSLKISLWSAQGVLENVRLRPEALNDLQLPVAIKAGSVGRLRLQVCGRPMGVCPACVLQPGQRTHTQEPH